MRKVTMQEYLQHPDRYELRPGSAEGAPPCPYGNQYEWVGYDKEMKMYVRFTKSVFKLLVEPPVATVKKGEDILQAIKLLDTRLYNIEGAYPTEDVNGTSYPGSTRYSVPYQSITTLPNENSSKPTKTKSWFNRLQNFFGKA